MSLADNLPSKEFGASLELGPEGGEFTNVKSDQPITDWSGVFEKFNLDPTAFRIENDSVRMSMWQSSKRLENGERDIINLYSYRARFVRITQPAIDLPALYAAARVKRPKIVTPPVIERATVVVYADPQVGKVGRRGGTAELLERSAEKRDKLHQLLKLRKPTVTVLADGGDGFEGFNSGGNPYFTNDLSLAEQMDCYGTELFEWASLLHRFAPVQVMAVTSNHTAWRSGKQQLGRPKDDLGLFVHQQVRKVAQAARMAAQWHFPADYDESVCIDVLGTQLGLVHGNQFAPNGAISWWEKQTFGAQAVTTADVLLTAHYHTFGAGVAGRNPVSGKQRYWLGAPTLDNGSDWFRQTAGRDSDPGLLVFDISTDGFDLGSLTIL